MSEFAPPSKRTSLSVVLLVAVLATATSLGNGFAYDDVPLIATNVRVHDLSHWWRLFATSYWPPSFGESLYRPVATLAWAIQWAIGGGAPVVFHMGSVLLYAALCAMVWRLFTMVLGPGAALVAGVLFAAHPVHSEAVASVAGQTELLAALGASGALVVYFTARLRGTGGRGAIVAIAALYAVASLAKEHALLLPLFILLAEWTVLAKFELRTEIAGGRSFRRSVLAASALVAIGVLTARTAVLGSLFGEQHVVEMDLSTRIWMMFRVVPEWTRLFYWPARLSAEHGPQMIDVVDGPTGLRLVGVAIVACVLGGFAIARQRDRVTAFALGWITIAFFPVSNLVAGLMIQERTLLFPSVGAVLLLARGGEVAWSRMGRASVRQLLLAGAMLLVVLGTLRTATRNPVWRDNNTLFAQTVQDAPRSYRAHYLYGTLLFAQGKPADGERELRLAIKLAYNDSDPYNYLATKYRESRIYAPAIDLYRQALAIRPSRPDSRFGLALSLLESGKIAEARAHADTGLASGQLRSYFEWVRARADSAGSRE